jgi:hypothetical protein
MATIENRVSSLLSTGQRVYYQAVPFYPRPGHPQYQDLQLAPVYIQYHIVTKTLVYEPIAMNVR